MRVDPPATRPWHRNPHCANATDGVTGVPRFIVGRKTRHRVMRVFLAGAAGAIGRRLVPLLLGAGHKVTGTTRSTATAKELERAGVTPAALDIFDAAAVTAAVAAAAPEVVVHQLTDLPRVFDQTRIV